MKDGEEMDVIEHPEHYNEHPSGIECIEIVQHMDFNIGTAIKHLWRAGLKKGVTYDEDLMKARQYIDFELQRHEEYDIEGVDS